ncbi:AbrB/MazE/SpoVT family DNA-binding domain-containing protein [bacterium]|nr:AbrB/MazE/SpoVT family DNA-binding domain-containing protein [bacterium]
MQLNIVQIGNSKGIRLPKSLMQQCHIKDSVNIEVKGNEIILRPILQKPRKGWAKMFSKEKSELVFDDNIDLDNKDWKW